MMTIFMKIILILTQSTYKKISEELMVIAWHPKRWCDFWMSEVEKKEIEPIFTE